MNDNDEISLDLTSGISLLSVDNVAVQISPMWSRPETRLLWLSVVVAASAAAVLWHTTTTSLAPHDEAESKHVPSSAQDSISSRSSAFYSHTTTHPARHRSPEDDVSISALRSLLSHPSYSIRNAAIRLILTRLVRHRLFAAQHQSYVSRGIVPGEEAVAQFHDGIAMLESYGWARKMVEDGEMPEGVWEEIVKGYEGFAETWEKRWKSREISSSGRGSTVEGDMDGLDDLVTGESGRQNKDQRTAMQE